MEISCDLRSTISSELTPIRAYLDSTFSVVEGLNIPIYLYIFCLYEFLPICKQHPLYKDGYKDIRRGLKDGYLIVQTRKDVILNGYPWRFNETRNQNLENKNNIPFIEKFLNKVCAL